MTDVAAAEVEPMPPVPLPPDATAELEAASTPEAPEAAASTAAPAERDLPFDVEHLGPLRRAVLDHLLDTDEPQSVAQILAVMPPGTTRGSGESAIKREFDAGRIERASPGVYRLAPARPVEQPKSSKPPSQQPEEEAMWFDALDAWINDPETWDRERFGPRPNEPGCRIPAGVVAKGVDRNRKRVARRKEAEAAQARQAAVDAELRTTLLAACNGNYSASLQADDLAPIREVSKVLALDRLLVVIRQKVDKRCFPGNPPLVSWRDPSFLRAVAEDFCRSFAVPGLVREWRNAGRTPATTTRASSLPPAGEMPYDNIDRSHHDQEHAPPGPHSLSKSPMDEDAGAARSAAPDVPAKATDASEAPAAASAPRSKKPRGRARRRSLPLRRTTVPWSADSTLRNCLVDALNFIVDDGGEPM
jgi:hypothetical protein